MILRALRFRNFGPFRGEHELCLGPYVYGVTARREDDAERSNGVGKSMLLEAVDLALWNRHRHRLEDEWITRGEREGRVSLEFDDATITGTTVTRSRKRGKRTELTVEGGGAEAVKITGASAQRIIDQIIGLSQDDYLATVRFEQRQVARFLLADPSDRMTMVTGWLRLAPLEHAAARARREAAEVAAEVSRFEVHDETLAERWREAMGDYTSQSLLEDLERAEQNAKGWRHRRDSARAAIEKNAHHQVAYDRRLAYESIARQYKQAKDELEATPADKDAYEHAREVLQQIRVKEQMAHEQEREARKVARGEFDGVCPVAGIQCPAKALINEQGLTAKRRLEKAIERTWAAQKDNADAEREEQRIRVAYQAHDRQAASVDALRQELLRRQAAYLEVKNSPAPTDPQLLHHEASTAEIALERVTAEVNALQNRLETLQHIARDRVVVQAKLKEARARLATRREGAQILGPGGAQQRVAENALGQIERAANDSLSTAGVSLEIALRWSRQGQGHARTCPACGWAFPASATVKVCERCKAGRGPNIIQRLEVELDDRSGGLEDLAGLSVQLAASAWLRNARGSAWEVAMLDEVTGALDRAHRRAVVSHLPAMLARAGVRQAFVVSHTSDVLDALPARIEVVAGADGSSARVIG